MGNEAKATFVQKSARAFWLFAGGLFILGVALRWVRLDWMSFLLDQAAICSRAAMIRSGEFPFTGIVNSMGFHNAPGYVWSLLPVFVFTTNPVITAAWHGLLSATMVFPLALLGRKYRHDALRWLPAIIAAVMPAWVFAGRDLWAQNFNVAIAAWAIYMVDVALDTAETRRRRLATAAVGAALGAWAVSVHYGAAPVFLVVLGALWPVLRKTSWRRRAAVLAPAAVICATMVPSIMDWFYRQANPLPKPEYAVGLERMKAEDLPLWFRLGHAAEVSVFTRSLDSVPGLRSVLPSATQNAVFGLDLLIGGLMLGGAGMCLIRVVKRSRDAAVAQVDQPRFCELLLVWLLVPAFMAALFLIRTNPGYLSASLPAGWLLILMLPQAGANQPQLVLKWLTRAMSLIVLLAGTIASVVMLSGIFNTAGVIRGYEMPYARQRDVVSHIVKSGIAPERIQHLSGPVFGDSYRYIARHLGRFNTESPGGASNQFALIEDVSWLASSPARRALLEQSGALRVGPVFVLVLPSRGAAEIFMRQYYEVN